MGNITFLGVEGSGKSVLMMALINLFKAHAQEGWFLRPETRSAFRFVEQVPTVLEPGALPHQTTELRHLAMSVVKDGEVQRVFDILDYPGEIYRLAFLDAKDDPDPATFQARVAANREEIRALLRHLQGSDRVYVLFNLADAQDLTHNIQNLDAVWVTNACLDYLHRLPSHPEIALLLTQIDLYGNLNNPNLNPRRIAQQALPLITRNFPNLAIQAVSALGPASGPFGVDNILANCLKDTPAVRSYKDPSTSPEMQDFLQAVQAFMGEVKDAKRLDVVYHKADAAYRSLRRAITRPQNAAPWFCRSQNHSWSVALANDTLRDWEELAAIYCSAPSAFQSGSSRELHSFSPRTNIGRTWAATCKQRAVMFRRVKVVIGGVVGALLGLLLLLISAIIVPYDTMMNLDRKLGFPIEAFFFPLGALIGGVVGYCRGRR
ncbi:MAG: hypothetical protein ACI4RT_06085 [Candidatus Spyradenecus sp.]